MSSPRLQRAATVWPEQIQLPIAEQIFFRVGSSSMFTVKTTTASAALLFLLASVQAAEKPQCRTFKEIYGTGKAMCENMWIGAFKYEPDPTKAYTMWRRTPTGP